MLQLINTYWRIIATSFSFFLFGIGTAFIGIIFQAIALLPFGNKQTWARKTIHHCCRFYINFMRLFGLLDYSIKLDKQNPVRGKLIIANHPTLLDAVFLFASFEDLCCITKAKLWHNPFTAGAVRVAGFIANDNANFINIAVDKVKAGENILIFPEGTRSSNVKKLHFKRGAANIAVQSSCEILPIQIHCEPITLQKGDLWYKIPPSKPFFSISTLPTVKLENAIDITRPRTLQYRDLTQHLYTLYQG